MTAQCDNCLARLDRLPNGKFEIVISVFGPQRPELRANNSIDPGKATNQEQLLKLVAISAAACAEHLAAKYGEAVDPRRCMVYAQRAFLEEMKLISEIARDIPAKVKRLHENLLHFSDQDQEYIKELKWHLGKGKNPTTVDGEVVNKLIKRLHH